MERSDISNAPVQPPGSSTPPGGSANIKPVKQQPQLEKPGFLKRIWKLITRKTEKAVTEVSSHALQETPRHRASSEKHTYRQLGSQTAQAAPAGKTPSRPQLSKAEKSKVNREAQVEKSMDKEVSQLSRQPSTPPPPPGGSQTRPALSREEVLTRLIEQKRRRISYKHPLRYLRLLQ